MTMRRVAVDMILMIAFVITNDTKLFKALHFSRHIETPDQNKAPDLLSGALSLRMNCLLSVRDVSVVL